MEFEIENLSSLHELKGWSFDPFSDLINWIPFVKQINSSFYFKLNTLY